MFIYCVSSIYIIRYRLTPTLSPRLFVFSMDFCIIRYKIKIIFRNYKKKQIFFHF